MLVQSQLHDINLNHIIPALNNKLDELFDAGEITTLDKIEIDIGTISSNATAEEWTERIVEKLEKKLQAISLKQKAGDNNRANTKNKIQHAVEVLCWFLKTGSLMRGSLYASVDELLKQLAQSDTDERTLLKKALIDIPDADIVAGRLAAMTLENQLLFLQLFVPGLSAPAWRNFSKKIFSLIEQLLKQKNYIGLSSVSAVFYKMLKAAFLHLITSAKENKLIPAKQFMNMVKTLPGKIVAGKTSIMNYVHDKQEEFTLPREKDKIAVDDEKMITDSTAVFVDNAGMSLVAAYLPSFFESLQLTNGKIFYNNRKQQHAIYLIHYLGTGEINAGEERLLFAKLLCGWPLQMPCYNEDSLSKEEIIASEDLLASLIEHWKALKTTSAAGLRESFLQRSGKLSEKEDHFVLQPEQQTIDILLEEVPWTFRLIKLPWMKKLIEVEWY